MSKKLLSKSHIFATAVAGTAIGSFSAANVSAQELFTATELPAGYQVAMSHGGKSTEAACGGMKSTEGTCGGKAAEATCGAKSMEGKCGADKAKAAKDKAMEGKCGEGKCGGKM